MPKNLFALFALTALIVAGCNSGNTLTREDAFKAYGGSQDALAKPGSMSPNNANQLTQALASSNASGLGLNSSFNCPEGGKASVSFSAQVEESSGSMVADINYDNCNYDGKTILSGDVHMEVTSGQSAQGVSVSQAMSGALDYSGEVEGSCTFAIDMATKVGNNLGGVGDLNPGDNVDIGLDINVSGDFCGFDIEDLEKDFAEDPKQQ